MGDKEIKLTCKTVEDVLESQPAKKALKEILENYFKTKKDNKNNKKLDKNSEVIFNDNLQKSLEPVKEQLIYKNFLKLLNKEKLTQEEIKELKEIIEDKDFRSEAEEFFDQEVLCTNEQRSKWINIENILIMLEKKLVIAEINLALEKNENFDLEKTLKKNNIDLKDYNIFKWDLKEDFIIVNFYKELKNQKYFLINKKNSSIQEFDDFKEFSQSDEQNKFYYASSINENSKENFIFTLNWWKFNKKLIFEWEILRNSFKNWFWIIKNNKEYFILDVNNFEILEEKINWNYYLFCENCLEKWLIKIDEWYWDNKNYKNIYPNDNIIDWKSVFYIENWKVLVIWKDWEKETYDSIKKLFINHKQLLLLKKEDNLFLFTKLKDWKISWEPFELKWILPEINWNYIVTIDTLSDKKSNLKNIYNLETWKQILKNYKIKEFIIWLKLFWIETEEWEYIIFDKDLQKIYEIQNDYFKNLETLEKVLYWKITIEKLQIQENSKIINLWFSLLKTAKSLLNQAKNFILKKRTDKC